MDPKPHDFSAYKALKISRPKPRLLEVLISQPGKLNAVSQLGHEELANVWRDIDRDPTIDVVLLRGDGGVFSAGGDLDMVKSMAGDWNTRMNLTAIRERPGSSSTSTEARRTSTACRTTSRGRRQSSRSVTCRRRWPSV